jgi:hypothetical protein
MDVLIKNFRKSTIQLLQRLDELRNEYILLSRKVGALRNIPCKIFDASGSVATLSPVLFDIQRLWEKEEVMKRSVKIETEACIISYELGYSAPESIVFVGIERPKHVENELTKLIHKYWPDVELQIMQGDKVSNFVKQERRRYGIFVPMLLNLYGIQPLVTIPLSLVNQLRGWGGYEKLVDEPLPDKAYKKFVFTQHPEGGTVPFMVKILDMLNDFTLVRLNYTPTESFLKGRFIDGDIEPWDQVVIFDDHIDFYGRKIINWVKDYLKGKAMTYGMKDSPELERAIEHHIIYTTISG